MHDIWMIYPRLKHVIQIDDFLNIRWANRFFYVLLFKWKKGVDEIQ